MKQHIPKLLSPLLNLISLVCINPHRIGLRRDLRQVAQSGGQTPCPVLLLALFLTCRSTRPDGNGRPRTLSPQG